MTVTLVARAVGVCPGYFADATGGVWSLKCGVLRRLCQAKTSDGYLKAKLTNPEGWHRFFGVSRLVATAFYGPRPEGLEARHLDGNRTNNAASNLAWGTHLENMRDCIRHGTQVRGVRQHKAKLCDADVFEIRTELMRGTSRGALAARFGVSSVSIAQIHRRVTWTHVADPPGFVKAPYGEGHRRRIENYKSNLTPELILAIREAWANGDNADTLVSKFKVGRSQAWRIATYRAWTHVK